MEILFHIQIHFIKLEIQTPSAVIIRFFLKEIGSQKQLVPFSSPFDSKLSSKIDKFNMNNINYTHRKQVFYHKKMVNVQSDCEALFLF